MDRQVYLSNNSSRRSQDFYTRALELVADQKEEDFYYLLPNGRTINLYRRKFMEDLGASFAINLFTFDDIVNNILDLDEDLVIGDELRYFILTRVLEDLLDKGELSFYRDFIGMDGFVMSLMDIIGRIKQELIRSEDFLSRLPEDPYYRELGLIYRGYEAYLRDKDILDREEVYFRAIEELEVSRLDLKPSHIFIDKFYDFRPVELKLLEKLVEEDINIYINIDYLMDKENRLLNKTIRSLKDLGFDFRTDKYPMNLFQKIGYSLFGQKEDLDGAGRVKLIGAASSYLELKKVFEDIKKELVGGMKISDIGLLPLDPSYRELIIRLAREEMLPVDLAEEEALINIRISRELLNILRLATDRAGKEDLLNRIRSTYFNDLDDQERGQIYSYIRNLNFKNISGLEDILRARDFDLAEDQLQLVLGFLRNIDLETKVLKELGSLEGFTGYIRDLFGKYNILEELEASLDEDIEEFARRMKVYKGLDSLLKRVDRLAELEEEISLEDYIRLLEDYLANTSIKLAGPNKEGLRVVDLISNRGLSFKKLYIMGLSQNIYPNIGEDNFLFQERHRRIVEGAGLSFNSYEDKLDNEIIKLASSIGAVEERLVLSYTSGENGDQASSIFLDEISRNLANIERLEVDFDQLIKEDLDDISNSRDYRKFILLRLRDQDINKYSYSFRPEELESLNISLRPIISRQAGDFNSYSGLIRDPYLLEILKLSYGESRKYSASSLENYNKCPFSFFMARVLGLEEVYEEEQELDFLKLGNLYHLVLRDFYRDHYREDLDWEELREIVEKLYKKYLEEVEFENTTSLDKLVLEDRLDRLLKFIRLDLDRIRKDGLEPWAFELAFGYDEDFRLGDLALFGRIDRIDRKEEGTVIIDYKSGGAYGVKDMLQGTSLQMPIYLMSQREKEPLAGQYGLINKAEYKLGAGLKDSLKSIKSLRSNKFDTREEWQDFFLEMESIILATRDGIRSGNFQVDPKVCSEYCPYRMICKYGGR